MLKSQLHQWPVLMKLLILVLQTTALRHQLVVSVCKCYLVPLLNLAMDCLNGCSV